MSNTTKDFISSIQTASKEKTSAYDSTATVKRIEGGTAWVHIPGGVDETPVAMTMNAKEGDSVQVRVSNGRAFLVGNATSPPTDDTTAEAAKALANRAAEDAGRAKSAADIAESYATSAQASAAQSANILEGMEQAAIAAGTTLDGIYADAAEAKATTDEINDYADTAGKTVTQILDDGETAGAAAQAASEAANSALVGLSTVEDVVGVLNWITEHGTMTLTSDVTVNPAHVYFVVDPAGDYVVGGTHYSIVSEPDDADIGTYYELSVDESVENYVATHIVVDTEGLWIIPDAGGNKVLIATGSGSTYTTAGTYIVGKVNGVDTVLAEFTASGAQIGLSSAGNVVVDNNSVDIRDNSTVYATFGANGVTVGRDERGYSHISVENNGMKMLYNVDFYPYGTRKTLDLSYGTTEVGGYEGNNPYYELGARKEADPLNYSPNATYDVGDTCRYNDKEYICNHKISTPEAWNRSHWNYITGAYSFLEGMSNIASGIDSHAEGNTSKAIGAVSHAEGSFSMSVGECSHAENNGVSYGDYSHAEGSGTANGDYSHAQNIGTKASSLAQTALGSWNVEDTADTYAVIVGNGSSGTPSNALTVDWSGNVEAAGDVTDGAGNTLSNKRSAAFVQMYHGNQALNNTARKITGLSISAGGNYSDYFDVGTADQVTIKKTGGYRIDMAMRFSAVTNAGNVKRISLYRNGSEFVVLMSRANSWEDFSTFYTQDLSVGDVLTMYGRSEDGNATASIERIYIEPIP